MEAEIKRIPIIDIRRPGPREPGAAADAGTASNGRLAVRRAPAAPRSAIGLPQHPDKHRPQGPVLLAVDQELGRTAEC
jgi:hypothetical protein